MKISPHERDQIGRELARIARIGGESLLCFRTPDCQRSTKDDGSPVTAADMASEQAIVSALTARYPQWAVISEEGEHAVQTGEAPFFLVDPLDGTRAFLAGRSDFCVLIALIEKGKPIASAIHQPVNGLTWWRVPMPSVPSRAMKRKSWFPTRQKDPMARRLPWFRQNMPARPAAPCAANGASARSGRKTRR